ncbi:MULTISPECIES: hypothetical protein [Enterobacter cloacae complex]|uniref:hypothetical protein n=1 Tax=Enterobacter cloacae complex TaxID=354276 RepID=UPI00097BF68F|nr:hypothetical protein [Enterobacter chengduensis]GJL42318.1 hypothetical protein TUM17577_35270 [Enterobacter asburiae]MBT1936387.1 hypothetical protein [Enterobacter chengduensis]MBT1964771.1 hypothetical protein [Enterobacter chengduensis]MCK6820957.1 hypothetical protein [Enterobacter chengduensis]MCK7171623.1 hypothetical protein [Enterobacter chengduensis]
MDNQVAQEEFEAILFNIRKSARYHRKRQSFFSFLDSSCNFISLIFGSSLIYGVLTPHALDKWLFISAITITFVSASNLIGRFSQKARDHSDFAKQFINLECDMIEVDKESLRADQVSKFEKQKLRIEANEMPTLCIMDLICFNEVARLIECDPKEFIRIHWYQRLFSPFFDIRSHAAIKFKDIPPKPTRK